MREDMSKVITERPRSGGGRHRKGRRLAIDELPSKEGMRRPYQRGYNAKEFSDLLGPLINYLYKQVDRPWDKVYSEICERISKKSQTHLHVLQHVNQSVFKIVIGKHGEKRFVTLSGYDYGEMQPVRFYGGNLRGELYIDPDTGLLKLFKVKKYVRPPEPITRIVIDKKTQLHLIKNEWYVIETAPLPEPVSVLTASRPSYPKTYVERYYLNDALLGGGGLIGFLISDFIKAYGDKVYGKSKRSASHAIKKKYVLA